MMTMYLDAFLLAMVASIEADHYVYHKLPTCDRRCHIHHCRRHYKRRWRHHRQRHRHNHRRHHHPHRQRFHY